MPRKRPVPPSTSIVIPDPEARKPRVLVVAHDVHWSGGMERAFAELIRHAHAFVDFDVLSTTLADELRPLVRWHRVRVPARPFPAKLLSFFALSWWRARMLDFDLVHTCGAITPLKADVVSIHFCHRGFQATGEGLVAREGSLPRRVNTSFTRLLSTLAERWCLRSGRVQRVACVSSGLAAEVQTLYPGHTVRVTPNGVDSRRFQRDPAHRDALRAEQGIPEKAVVALFVGGDWDRKGLSVAITGLSEMSGPGADHAILWVVGPGEIARYEGLAAGIGVADRVRFFGPRHDTHRFYSAADLFVLPSKYETFSLVAHEAAAASLPIVATNVHGIAELVAAGAGVSVRRAPADVGRAMSALLQDPQLRTAMGAAGRAHVKSITWSHSAQSVIGIYNELYLTGGRSRPVRQTPLQS